MKAKILIGKNKKLGKNAIVGFDGGRKLEDPRLIIGESANIRSNTVIYLGSKIGSHLETGHNVVIREQNQIGDHFAIWSNSVIDYGSRIGHRVKIHCNCYISQFTTIEDDAFLAPGVIVANDLHPGTPDMFDCMRGPTIKKGAQIGCNVTLLPHVTIGEHALIGAGSVVTHDIPAYTVAAGNPARVLKKVKDYFCKIKKNQPYDFLFKPS